MEEDLRKKNWSNQFENPQSTHQSGLILKSNTRRFQSLFGYLLEDVALEPKRLNKIPVQLFPLLLGNSFHQYQVVWRKLPTAFDELAKIYGMKLWA